MAENKKHIPAENAIDDSELDKVAGGAGFHELQRACASCRSSYPLDEMVLVTIRGCPRYVCPNCAPKFND